MGRIASARTVLLLANVAVVASQMMMEPHAHRFGPLRCNDNITDAVWETWSQTELPTTSTSAVVEIPCGRRILMDLSGSISFGGLVVHGHLKFQDTGIHITTDHVIVQGFLTIGENQNPVTNKVIFTLDGTTEPDASIVEAVRDDCMGMCGAGIQGFTVIGGVLDLHGMPYDSNGNVCPTWLELQDSVSTSSQSPSNPDPAIPSSCATVFANPGFEEAPTRPEISQSCGKVLSNWNFEEPSPLPSIPASCGDNLFVDGGIETGAVGAWVASRTPLEVDNTTMSGGAFSLHVPSPSQRAGQYLTNAAACLTAGVQYVFSAKVLLPPGASCFSSNSGCPYVKLRYKTDASSSTITSSTFGSVEGPLGTDGAWNDMYVGITFTQEQLDAVEFFLYVDLSGDGEFWLDDVRLFQPPKPPVGWEIYDNKDSFIETVYDESEAHEGDSYMLMKRSHQTSEHRVGSYIEPSCLTNDVHYEISAWVKVDELDPQDLPKIMLRWRNAAGSMKWITLATTQTGNAEPTAGEWLYLWGHEIFEPAIGEDLTTGSEFFVYVDVPGTQDFAVDEVQIFLPALAPPPAWSKRGESGGFLGVVSDGTAFEGSNHLRVYGRDYDNSDYAFQVFTPEQLSCLLPDVEYVISVMVRLPAGALCFTDAEEDCPYLQVRTKASASSSEVSRFLADIDGPEGTDGAWNVLWAKTSFTATELAASEFFRIEVRVGGNEDYFLDKAELLLAPQAANPADACEELLKNGDFDWHHGAFAPWSVSSDERIVPSGGVDGGAYLFNFDRSSSSHGPAQYVDTGCVQAGAVYEFRASTYLPADHSCVTDGSRCPKMVVRSTTAGKHDYRTFTLPESAATPEAWNSFTYTFRFTTDESNADSVYVYVEGGSSGSDVGFDQLSLARVSLGKNALIVDARAADGCWAVGDEVVVTPSDTEREHAERRTITQVEDLGDGTARVTVDANLEWLHEGAGDWHAEVMLLTRKIVVHGTETATNVAGHFWVKHTAPTQTIEGVELHTMGQQGTLGRYPMHFHMCQDMIGTKVSSLSIHDTFQRCVVIHGTDNVAIESNVAYSTQGHCFFLEDGYEEGNQFLYNIGALTRAPDGGAMTDETDDDPSTFWISNPNNVYIGNVAAGSARSGYWFELRDRVRGPSAELPKAKHYFGQDKRLNPERHYMGTFEDNRAHSNSGNGLQTYPSRGYNPSYGWANFTRFTTFRNGRAGIRFHVSDHCRAVELLSADNRYGVDDDRNTDIQVLDSTIIGVSAAFEGKDHGNCPRDPAYGIQLHAQSSDGDKRGTVMSNVAFSGFDPQVCPGSSALTIDDEQQRFWDPRHVTSGLSFDVTSRRAYFPTFRAEDLGMGATITDANNQVAIFDSDGSLMGTPGYLVSNNANIIDSASCTLHTSSDLVLNNLYTCPGACYRARTVAIPPVSTAWLGMAQPQLQVSWVDGAGMAKTLLLNGTASSINDNRNQDNRRHEYFVVLPSGFDVAARFVAGGQTYTPLFVESPLADSGGYADPDPSCSGEFASFSVDLGARSPCGELLSNGGVESGADDAWWVRGMYDAPCETCTLLSVVDDASSAASGRFFLEAKAKDRTSEWHGASQYVPVDRMRVGETYRWSMQLRLPTLGASNTESVELRMKLSGAETSSEYDRLATLEVSSRGWTALEHVFEWTERMAGFQTALLYVHSISSGLDVHYDDWSLQMVGECLDCGADADCDDGNVCDGLETCSLGYCHSGSALTCDDGRWCNGAETCDAVGGCQAGEAPSCAGSTPLCNETSDSCECTTDAHCDSGLFCAPAVCESGQCLGITHTCEGAFPLCKEETDECVSECLVDGVCDFPYETAASCPDDCTTIQPVCGNGLCEPWGHAPETCKTCASDCDAPGIACAEDQPLFVCGNGVVEAGETRCNCPADVASVPEDSASLCSDGLDNDCDGLADHADPNCAPFFAAQMREAERRPAAAVAATASSSSSGLDPAAAALVALSGVLAALVAIAAVVTIRRARARRREEQAEAWHKLGVISHELTFDVGDRDKGRERARGSTPQAALAVAVSPARKESMLEEGCAFAEPV